MLEISVAGVNVAAPTDEFSPNHFIVCEEVPDIWIDGHAVTPGPDRLVRQFLLIRPNLG
jgi:hypothetical protein